MTSNREVALRWAQANYAFNRDEIRPAKSGHMFYRDNIIFSYGEHFPIARYDRATRLTLLTSRSYSVTTARHISHVYSAIQGAFVRVPDVYANDHVANVTHFVTEIQRTEAKIIRARRYADFHYEDTKRIRAELVRYCAAFGLLAPVVRTPDAVTLKLIKLRLRVGA